tara:strand:- start:319 stop:858 length:540 start_codon:yes stop_codon:yes gene_type:complete
MTVMHPCDDLSAEELTVQLLNHDNPSYTRTARNKTPRMYDQETCKSLKIGKGSVLREGGDVAIISCGVMVSESMKAAEYLSSKGIEATVVDMHTLKPLDTDLIDELVGRCKGLVTAEDHSVIGGLGSAVAEHVSYNGGTPLRMVGVPDRFGESGTPQDLMEAMGITYGDIATSCESLMS